MELDSIERLRCDCGNLCKPNGYTRDGKRKFKSYCNSCGRKRHWGGARPYTKFRKDECGRCGFEPEHLCQLDIDHIDGNHDNNDPTNLQTLCANCHRLKSLQEGDFEPKSL